MQTVLFHAGTYSSLNHRITLNYNQVTFTTFSLPISPPATANTVSHFMSSAAAGCVCVCQCGLSIGSLRVSGARPDVMCVVVCMCVGGFVHTQLCVCVCLCMRVSVCVCVFLC